MFSKLLIYYTPSRITAPKKVLPPKPKPSAVVSLHCELLITDQEIRWMPFAL